MFCDSWLNFETFHIICYQFLTQPIESFFTSPNIFACYAWRHILILDEKKSKRNQFKSAGGPWAHFIPTTWELFVAGVCSSEMSPLQRETGKITGHLLMHSCGRRKVKKSSAPLHFGWYVPVYRVQDAVKVLKYLRNGALHLHTGENVFKRICSRGKRTCKCLRHVLQGKSKASLRSLRS